jgi:hypothetical protein
VIISPVFWSDPLLCRAVPFIPPPRIALAPAAEVGVTVFPVPGFGPLPGAASITLTSRAGAVPFETHEDGSVSFTPQEAGRYEVTLPYQVGWRPGRLWRGRMTSLAWAVVRP